MKFAYQGVTYKSYQVCTSCADRSKQVFFFSFTETKMPEITPGNGMAGNTSHMVLYAEEWRSARKDHSLTLLTCCLLDCFHHNYQRNSLKLDICLEEYPRKNSYDKLVKGCVFNQNLLLTNAQELIYCCFNNNAILLCLTNLNKTIQ